jgi:hypothetical protein
MKKNLMGMSKDKRGVSLSELPNTIIGLVVTGAVALVGFIVWQSLADSTTNTDAGSFLANITLMFANVGEQLPLVGTIIAFGLVLGIVMVAFAFGRRRGAI